jgi:hypothetical protein
MKVRIEEEGICTRCGKTVTRKSGERWHDQFGRDRCRADFNDGECNVIEWYSSELEPAPLLPLLTITLHGRDTAGRIINLVQQQLPATAGMNWTEQFTEPLELYGWSITVAS